MYTLDSKLATAMVWFPSANLYLKEKTSQINEFISLLPLAADSRWKECFCQTRAEEQFGLSFYCCLTAVWSNPHVTRWGKRDRETFGDHHTWSSSSEPNEPTHLILIRLQRTWSLPLQLLLVTSFKPRPCSFRFLFRPLSVVLAVSWT